MNDVNAAFKLVAKAACTDSCCCPTVLEAESGEELVIVGKLDDLVQRAPGVQQHVGQGEIAVVIPRSLLLQAAKALA